MSELRAALSVGVLIGVLVAGMGSLVGCRPEGAFPHGDGEVVDDGSGGAIQPGSSGGSGGRPTGSGGAPIVGSGGTVADSGGVGVGGGSVAGATASGGGVVTSGGAAGGSPGTGGSGGVRSGGAGGQPASGGAGGRAGAGAGGGNGGAGGRASGGAGGRAGSGAGGATILIGGGGAGAGGGGPPTIMSIDFVGGITAAGGAAGATAVVAAPAMTPAEIAGFRPAANWNSAPNNMGSLTNLFLGSGVQTLAVVSWSAPIAGTNPGQWKNAFTDAPGDTRMMNGYLDPSAAATPATITVTGLPPEVAGTSYDVYVYATGDIPSATTRTGRYAIGAAAVSVSQTGPTTTVLPAYAVVPAAGGAGNVVIFRGVTGTEFTLIATPMAGAPARSPVNGLQIVSPSGR